MNVMEMRLAVQNYQLEIGVLKRMFAKAPRTSSAFQNWCKKTAGSMPMTTKLAHPSARIGGDWHAHPAVRYTSVLSLMVALGRVVKTYNEEGCVYQLPTSKDL